MITEYDDEHMEFLRGLIFEEYNSELKEQIYNFYRDHGVKCYLPETLGMVDNSLEYVICYSQYPGDKSYRIVNLSRGVIDFYGIN